MTYITFEFACMDDCLDKMVPSDLRQIVAERDRLLGVVDRAAKAWLSVQGIAWHGDLADAVTAGVAEIDRLRERVTELEQHLALAAPEELCRWSSDNDGAWSSACGSEWCFTDDGPNENGMNYCHKCGKPLVVQVFEEVADDDE